MAAVNPNTLAAFSRSWDFSSGTDTHDDATTVPGYTGSKLYRTPAGFTPFFSYTPCAPVQGGGATVDCFYGDTEGRYGVISGTGAYRGLCTKQYTGTAQYPNGDGGGGLLAVSEQFQTLTHNQSGGATWDPQDFGFILAFTNPQPRNTADTDACLLTLNDKLRLETDDNTQLLKVTSSGAGGGTSSFYAHAGINIVAVQSGNTACNVFHQDAISSSPEDVGAVGGTTASAVLTLGGDTGGTHRFRGRFMRLYIFGAGFKNETSQNIINAMQFVAEALSWQAKTKLVVAFGTSITEGYFDIPGTSTMGRVAEAHPEWLVMNYARGGANFVGASNDMIDDQIPYGNAALEDIPGLMCSANAKKLVYIEGGTNENAGTTPATTNTNLGTCLAAIVGANYKIGCTPRVKAQIGQNDTVVFNQEDWNRTFAPLVRARVPATLNSIIDRNAEFDTGSGSAADTRLAITTDALKRSNFCFQEGDFDDDPTPYSVNFIADTSDEGADGIHGGPTDSAEVATALLEEAEPLLASTSGGSRTARRLLLGV